MKSPTTIRATSSSLQRFHPYPRRRTSATAQTPSVTVTESTNRPDIMIYAKPFDHYQPRGGGATQDIFRRFKIRKSEEEEFMIYWSRNSIPSGIFTRDENHTLVFRVSSSDRCDLSDLGIGPVEARVDSGIHWMHVYDEDGISWLTQFRCTDADEDFPKVFDRNGRAIKTNGRIGRYGPSGMTPADFFFSRLAIQNGTEARENEDRVDSQ